MCEKCGPFDERIALYQNLLRAILDQQTVHGIGELIRKLEAQKKAFHPEEWCCLPLQTHSTVRIKTAWDVMQLTSENPALA
jgi:hypothetical protein